MKKRILKAVVFVLAICAVLPTVAALADTSGGNTQQAPIRKPGPIAPH